MQHPYQSICLAGGPGSESSLLIAACGPKIYSVDYPNGAKLSEWSSIDATTKSDAPQERAGEGPPSKKQKVEGRQFPAPNVIKLVVAPDQKHVVAVTGDDKCIRVFAITPNGELKELSQRCMPKRPCALVLTPDSSTILCGDKFGDVYSLPLLPGKYIAKQEQSNASEKEEQFRPAGSVLTVHSLRNRKALEEQLKQKSRTPRIKEPLAFEHQLLLGHVSMLTDMALGQRTINGQSRDFIITADRDEHIRISRGPPQAHVIEGFCLGHKEFISRLCAIPGTTKLVSGGGDDWLGVWDWTTNRLLTRHNLRSGIRALSTQATEEILDEGNIAVSGLWTANGVQVLNGEKKVEPIVLVALEQRSVVVVCPLSSLGDSSFTPIAIDTSSKGKLVDVASHAETAIMTFDAPADDKRVGQFEILLDGSLQAELREVDSTCNAIIKLNSLDTPNSDRKAIDDLLYGVEKLRKQPIAEDHDDVERVEGDDTVQDGEEAQ